MKPEEFEQKLSEGGFLESALVHGHRYGSPKSPVIHALQAGKDVLMNLDVQGAATIRDVVRHAPPGDPLHRELIDIFVVPPSLEILKNRLTRRGKDTPQTIDRRLKQAEEEISHWREYTYAVVNNDLAEAYDNMRAIILAERHKIRNRADDR
jgi:guanylate kinase